MLAFVSCWRRQTTKLSLLLPLLLLQLWSLPSLTSAAAATPLLFLGILLLVPPTQAWASSPFSASQQHSHSHHHPHQPVRSNHCWNRGGASFGSLSFATTTADDDTNDTNETETTPSPASPSVEQPQPTNVGSKKKQTKKAPMIPKHVIPLAEKACAYLTASTDPYHAVAHAIQILEQQGFRKWSMSSSSSSTPAILQPGGKYYYTVQQSTLVAFSVGGQVERTAVTPFCVIGGHTDSPNFRLKPRSQCATPHKNGLVQLGVECYGGGLWHTWLDRDLSVSGQVLVRHSTGDKISRRLVQLKQPVARISSLCIHLQTATEREALKLNKETHTVPMIASAPHTVVTPPETTTWSSSLPSAAPLLEQALEEQINVVEEKKEVRSQDQNKHDDDTKATTKTNEKEETDPWRKGQEPLLLQRIAEELQKNDKNNDNNGDDNINDNEVITIADWDLSLYDVQPAALGGLHSEFLYSGRLDNLATVFCAVTALAQHDPCHDAHINLVVAFDHEEVGSVSAQGAGSPVLEQALQHISQALLQSQEEETLSSLSLLSSLYPSMIRQSFCLSVDQAHAVHPNYASKHESVHGPTLNSGLVIKTNSNQRYATSPVTGFLVRELGRLTGVPIQEFVVRNDCPCGSTIGPTISARTGLRTIDLGMPQLSMHSCREVMGTVDLIHAVNLFRGYFQHFPTVDRRLQLDE